MKNTDCGWNFYAGSASIVLKRRIIRDADTSPSLVAMQHSRWRMILTIGGIGGGLALTLLSGLYAVYEPIIDAERMHFGFPFAWLNAIRSGWNNKPPIDWVYSVFWPNFVVDFAIYGLISVAAVYWTRRIYH